MVTQEQIKHVTSRLKEETAKRQRSRMESYLKKTIPQIQKRPPPPIIRSIFDISQKNLPTYHNEVDLEKALETIDLGKIYNAVDAKEEEQKKMGKYKDAAGLQLDYSDFLVQELLKWYKEEFFKWVNSPSCHQCRRTDDVKLIGRAEPTQEEAVNGGASIVELYQCSRCQLQIRFPRYNKLSKLLEWRQGRCGEWNNCFLLLLNSLNIRARYLWNAEDHVWCEYYSESLKRWVHLDSCENSFDEPLLYNKGWGKKMSYVFAIGDDYIIDVSDKYIVKDQLPRNQISQGDLAKYLNVYNFSKWVKLQDQQLFDTLVSYNRESRTLKPAESKTQDVLKPRQSGQGNWTQSRGEAGR